MNQNAFFFIFTILQRDRYVFLSFASLSVYFASANLQPTRSFIKNALDKVITSTYFFLLFQPGSTTESNGLQCLCNHLTSFGGDVVVAPNTISFGKVWSGFASLHETGNVAVLATVIAVFLIYCVILIWARRADKCDKNKVKQMVKFSCKIHCQIITHATNFPNTNLF